MESKPFRREAFFGKLLERIFKDAGWGVELEPQSEPAADLLVSNGPHSYLIELKVAHEGRKDRVLPLLSMAILQAQAAAKQHPPSKALAVVAAPRISDSLASDVMRFASSNAPNVPVGMLDLDGFRAFSSPDLQILNAERSAEYEKRSIGAEPSADLFSDLNQWLLKVLFAKYIPEHLLHSPRGDYRNASELAKAAGVSVMSAFRFVRRLEAEQFLDASRSALKLVRIEELLRRWQSAVLKPPHEFPLRWIIKSQSPHRLRSMLRSYNEGVDPAVRVCLGLFSAADVLGFGIVQGVPEYIYVEKMNPDVANQLGLSLASQGKIDVIARRPSARRSIFQGAIVQDGVPVCDILQVWLDVSAHPARGSEQANEIKARILNPLLKDAKL